MAARKKAPEIPPTLKAREPVPPNGPVIVGVGASAGGLEAFTQLLTSLPPKPGVALVFVQHLSPDHESFLPILLARATTMPVSEARDGSILEADKVHVIPPDMDIAIADGHLRLVPRPARRAPHMPLDLFLGTLAKAQGSRAIAVILSGTGSDGTLGCQSVKTAGGITLAQEPASARYDGMPKSAIAAGCIDFVLPPDGIAREIVRLAREPYVSAPAKEEAVEPAASDQASLARIFALLKKQTGADFSSYKKTTVLRRIQRRMVLRNVEAVADYAAGLDGDLAEVQSLHADLLINVTSFFRDPDTFAALAAVLPRILHERSVNAPVRVWIPGCATGEEAYSVAICLLEALSDVPSNVPVQVFATDLSETAVDKARAAVYLENVAADVSPERLARFFVKVDGSYHVSKAVRDMIVFARHDLARDPPFSRLDLVSCRNVLIYLEAILQRRVLSTFHYALAPGGFLVLGRSETVGASADLFDLVDKEHRIYARTGADTPLPVRPEASSAPAPQGVASRALPTGGAAWSDGEREAERLLLNRFAPASVLVDDKEQVLHVRGPVDRFLTHAQGAASLDLGRMAPRELLPDLRRLLRDAREKGVPRRKSGLVVRQGGRSRKVSLEVLPVRSPASGERRFLVLFEEGGRSTAPKTAPVPRAAKGDAAEVARLEQDLESLRHHLRTMEEEQAASQEELQSGNEEVLSSNEELQSVNEELLTAKEELQSGNEELTTLNDELRNRNFELQRLTDDLDNFVASATIPIVMLGRDLVVRRFTPAAAKLMAFSPADVGRSLAHVRTGLDLSDLEPLVREVLDGQQPSEREVQDRHGCWWRLHVRPYRTRRNEVDGAVLVLVDVDALTRSRGVAEDARDFADAIVNTVREPLLVLDADLRIRRANRAFHQLFRDGPLAAPGLSLFEIGNGQWDQPAVRTALEEILGRGDVLEDHLVQLDLAAMGSRTLKLNGRRLRQPATAEEMILLAIEDVTVATRLEEERADLVRRSQDAKDAAVSANRMKDEFVATASHELRGPLNAMVGWVHVLSSGPVDEATRARALAAIDRSVKAQTRLVTELLDVTRIMTGKLQLSMRLVEMLDVVESAMQAVRPAAQAKGVSLALAEGAAPETVLADKDRLHQVVWNLLSNAVKFTPPGGRVEVKVAREATSAQLTVTDTGQGIPLDFLPYVFERFRQADSSSTRAQPGLGLGLAIARQLVEMHGGTVTAWSAGEGKGATFVVSLPVPALRVEPPRAEDAEQASPSARPDPTVDLALAGVRVLVVEDDPDGRDVVTTVLERRGAQVTAVGSVAAALQAFDREPPDVLVSDIGMPGRDGYDLIRDIRLRARDAAVRTPALALTAFATKADQAKATAAGFDAYLAKPAEPADLVAAVSVLARRSSG